MIPPRNLSLLANRLAKAGSRRLPEAVLERDYCLAWFFVALSRTPLRERLAFKGGTAIKRSASSSPSRTGPSSGATRSTPTFPTTRRSAFTPSARSWLRRWSR